MDTFDAIERERQLIGQKLHDSVCQSLAAMSLCGERLLRQLKASRPIDAAEIEMFQALLEKSQMEARSLYDGLQPLRVSPTALLTELSKLAERTSNTLPCAFHCEKVIRITDDRIAQALYHVAQEIIWLARREGADRVSISLAETDTTLSLQLDIERTKAVTSDPLAIATHQLLMEYARAAGLQIEISAERVRAALIRTDP